MAIKSRPKGGSDIPGQKYVPQAERYTGSEVLGMEYTTARPMHWETGMDACVPMPGKPWTEESRATMWHKAKVAGRDGATLKEIE